MPTSGLVAIRLQRQLVPAYGANVVSDPGGGGGAGLLDPNQARGRPPELKATNTETYTRFVSSSKFKVGLVYVQLNVQCFVSCVLVRQL